MAEDDLSNPRIALRLRLQMCIHFFDHKDVLLHILLHSILLCRILDELMYFPFDVVVIVQNVVVYAFIVLLPFREDRLCFSKSADVFLLSLCLFG